MADWLSNYWVGLLVLGPIAGVLWALIFGRSQQNRARGAEYIVEGNSGQVVFGNRNKLKQVKDSYNRNIVNNNYHGKPGNDGTDDVWTFVILAIGGTLLVGSLLSWGMAKYGALVVSLEMALVSVIGVCLVFHLLSRFMSGEYQNKELPVSLVLLTTGSFAFFTVNNLEKFLRQDLSELVYQYSNVFKFFWDLEEYDKTYLVVQAVCVIFVLFSVAYISARAYFLQRGKCSWYVDAFLFPVFGLLPFWLSHPNWGILFVYERF